MPLELLLFRYERCCETYNFNFRKNVTQTTPDYDKTIQ